MPFGARPLLLTLALLLAAVPIWSQEKKPATPSDLPAHIQAAQTFLMAWGKGNWDEARTVSAEKVPVKVGDKEFTLDLTGGKAEAVLVFPFRGISTVRVEGKVKGVTVDEIGLKAGETEKRGKGTLTLEEKDGKFVVTAVAVE